MRRQAILITLYAFIFYLVGCSATRTVPAGEHALIDSSTEVLKIETTEGKFLSFGSDRDGHAHLQDSTLVRILDDGSVVSIPLSDIKTLYPKDDGQVGPITAIAVSVAVGVIVFVLSPIKIHM